DSENLDVHLLERVIHVVDLVRVEIELVQRERDLVRRHRARLLGALQQPLRLFGLEDVRDSLRTPRACNPCAQLRLPSLSCASRLTLAWLVTTSTIKLDAALCHAHRTVRHGPFGSFACHLVPILARRARKLFASFPSGEAGASDWASCSSARAFFTSPSHRSRTPRWKRTVAACGKTRTSGPRRENARSGWAVVNR